MGLTGAALTCPESTPDSLCDYTLEVADSQHPLLGVLLICLFLYTCILPFSLKLPEGRLQYNANIYKNMNYIQTI